MRKVMLLILICLSLNILLQGCIGIYPQKTAEWVNISSNAEASNYSLHVADGIIYRALALEKANVRMYEGIGWQDFGNYNFSVGDVEEIKLTSEGGLFYVAFNDTYVGKGIVMKCQSADGIWERVGKTGYFSNGEVYDISIVVKDQVPYISYRDKTDNKFVTVKVDGDAVTVLNEVPLLQAESIYMMQLAVMDGDIYLVCSVNASAGKLKVMKLDGLNWSQLGEYAAAKNIYSFSPDSYDHQFYIAYSTDERVNVVKFDGLNWSPLTDPNIVYKPLTIPDGSTYEEPPVAWLSVGNGQVHLLYGDYDKNFKASVKRLNGLEWEFVGVQGFSDGAIFDGGIFSLDKKIYVGFLEASGDEWGTGFAKVWRCLTK